MMNMKEMNRELTDDELEFVAGGELSPGAQRELLADIKLAKIAGHSMERCIRELCALSKKSERADVEAFIRANWNSV